MSWKLASHLKKQMFTYYGNSLLILYSTVLLKSSTTDFLLFILLDNSSEKKLDKAHTKNFGETTVYVSTSDPKNKQRF